MSESKDESFRVVHPLFGSDDDGEKPTSPKQMEFGQIDRHLFAVLNEAWHSRLPVVTNCFEGICYGMFFKNYWYAVAWWSKPIAQNRLKDGKSLYELRRMAISDDAPKNTASKFLSLMEKDIKRRNKNIKKLISYQDTDVHIGTIYKASNWVVGSIQDSHSSWENRSDFNRKDQTKSIKVRWERVLK